MATKKVSLKEFNALLVKIVREELSEALKEDISPHIKRIRDSEAMAAWLMRQYFDPNKHADKIWYNPSVNANNVLEFVSNTKNNFPLSPKEVADMWKLKKSLGSSMKLVAKDLEGDSSGQEPAEDEGKEVYQTGEVTLKDIGQELGGLTPTMINKLAASGMEKVKKITKGVAPWDMETEQWDELMGAIMKARQETAQEFASALKSHAGDVKAFLQELEEKHILSPGDMKLVSDKEVEGLAILSGKEPAQIINVLLSDIERDDNIFKSFQSAVSKKIFPPAKRGRPRKNVEGEESED